MGFRTSVSHGGMGGGVDFLSCIYKKHLNSLHETQTPLIRNNQVCFKPSNLGRKWRGAPSLSPSSSMSSSKTTPTGQKWPRRDTTRITSWKWPLWTGCTTTWCIWVSPASACALFYSPLVLFLIQCPVMLKPLQSRISLTFIQNLIFIYLSQKNFLTEFRLHPRSWFSSNPCKQRVSFNATVPRLAETLDAWGKQAGNKIVSRHFYCALELHGAVKWTCKIHSLKSVHTFLWNYWSCSCPQARFLYFSHSLHDSGLFFPNGSPSSWSNLQIPYIYIDSFPLRLSLCLQPESSSTPLTGCTTCWWRAGSCSKTPWKPTQTTTCTTNSTRWCRSTGWCPSSLCSEVKSKALGNKARCLWNGHGNDPISLCIFMLPDNVFCESSPPRSLEEKQTRAKRTFEEMMSYIPGIQACGSYPRLLSASHPRIKPRSARQRVISIAFIFQTSWGNVWEKRPSMKESVSSLMDCSSRFWTNRYEGTRTNSQMFVHLWPPAGKART